ncbi:CBS domain containing-hemolysin-like protein OS=Streptomyces violarus OX=67380 GN=FHS41_008033 PE=4 SV=1 [Streptomyces violarus]
MVLPLERVVYARGAHPDGLERLSAESGFSRFPVVDEGRRIVGYLHVKDALEAAGRDVPFRLRDMRPSRACGSTRRWTTSWRCGAAVRTSRPSSGRTAGWPAS